MFAFLTVVIGLIGLALAIITLLFNLFRTSIGWVFQFFSTFAMLIFTIKVRWVFFFAFENDPNVGVYATLSPILLLPFVWGLEKIPNLFPKGYYSRLVAICVIISGFISIVMEVYLLTQHSIAHLQASQQPTGIMGQIFPAVSSAINAVLDPNAAIQGLTNSISTSWNVIDWKLLYASGFAIFFGFFWFFLTNGLFTKDKIKEATDKLHGSAKWADWKEIKKDFSKGDIILGDFVTGNGKETQIKADVSQHLVTMAGTGGGKTRSIIMPNVLNYPRQLIVFDPKGEIAEICAEERAQRTGRDYRIIDAREGAVTDSLNVLDWIDRESKYAQKHCEVLAEAFTATSQSNEHRDQFFEKRAQKLLAMVMYEVIFNPSIPEKDKNLLTVSAWLSSVDLQERFEDVLNNISRYPNPDIYSQKISQLLRGATTANGPTFSSIVESATGLIEWIPDEGIADLICGNVGRSFSINDIIDNDLDIYITVDSGSLLTNPSLARLLITAIFYQFKRGLKKTKGKTLFMIDEMPRLGKLDRLAEYRDEIRGFGVTMWSFVQSMSQLKEIWGQEGANIWISSAEILQYSQVNELALAEYIEKSFGTYTEHALSTTEGQSVGSPLKTKLIPNPTSNKGRSVKVEKKALISATSVLELSEDGERKQLIKRGGAYPANPIKANLTPYYDYPEFAHLVEKDKEHGRENH